MRNKYKAFLSLFIASSLFLGTSCGENKDNAPNEVEIFGSYITEKILRDVKADDSQKLTAEFSIVSAKGETEDSQIVLTPKKDVKSCTISVSELTMEDGTEFPAESISLYYQKYIEITTRSDGYTNNPFGFYPDMLLPYEKAVEYKENTIKGGENQSIILSAKVSEAQKAGIYTGKATIVLDDIVKEIPIKIEVKDVTLPAEKHLLTNYNTDYVLIVDGELNDTIDMYNAYCDTLLEYNVTPRRLPGWADVEFFKTQIRNYYDRVSSYEIPTDQTSSFSPEKLREYLQAVVEISLEDGRNYFEKARYWLYSVDEPIQNNRVDAANQTFDDFHATVTAFADEVENLDIPDNGNVTKQLLAEEIRNAKALLTTYYSELLEDIDIWCPPIANMNKTADREYYEEEAENEYWVYTLNTSTNYQPSLHIDNVNGLNSSRILGWICNDYGISGRLYYQSCYQQKVSYTGGFHYEKCDPYNDPMRYPGTNGDGFVLYPGARYGIFGPIASNRLVSIRDSIDDYELLYQLENKYLEAGYDASEILSVIYDSLYSGVYVSAGGAELFNAREQLFNLHALADKGVYLSDCERTTIGYLVAVEGTDIKVEVNGQNVQASNSINVNLSENINTLTVKKDDVKFSYVFGGKKHVVVNYNQTEKEIGVADSKIYEHSTVDGIEIGETGKVEKVVFNSEKKNVYIRPKGIENLLNKNTREMTMVFYNPTQAKLKVTIYVEGNVESPIDTYWLKPGKNTFVLGGIDIMNWRVIGKATGIQLKFESADELTTLYLGEVNLTEVVS